MKHLITYINNNEYEINGELYIIENGKSYVFKDEDRETRFVVPIENVKIIEVVES